AGQLLYVIDIAATTASDALVIDLMTRSRKVNGEWAKPKPARLTTAAVAAMPDPADRDILERLSGARPQFDWGGYSGYGQDLSRVQLRGVMITDVVPRACATGRCAARISAPHAPPASASLAPLAWDDGAPWTFAVSVEALNSGYAIEGWLQRDGARMELTEALALLAEGILLTSTHAARLAHGGAAAWLAALRRTGRVMVPAGARDELADALLGLGPLLASVPDDLRVETVPGEPQPHLRVRPPSHRSVGARADRLAAELVFEYEGTLVDPASPRRIVRLAGTQRAVRRDLDSERRAFDTLLEHGARNDWSVYTGRRALQLPSSLLPRTVRQLLGEGWHVEAAGQVYRRPSAPPALQVASGIDWFELRGDVAYDDQQASLPALLAALDRGESFVTLGDGTIGLLPDDWLAKHALIARLGSRDGTHLRFKTSQVGLLDSLLAAQPDASWDDTFARARADLLAFDGIRPAEPPATFVGTLRGYQREGLGWLLFLQRFGFGGCLADDMGLGKT